MNDFLPVVVPFFGAAVFLSWTVTCCAARRSARAINALQSRVEALELQRAPAPPAYQQPIVPVVQTVPYQYPPQQQQQPPPYNAGANRVMAYYIPPPFAQQQQQARASAPPL